MFGVAKIKSSDPLEKRFHGLCAFVRLHLMKAAEGDVEAGFAAARGRGMIGEQDERFLRSCLADDDRLAQGESLDGTVTPELLETVQAKVNKLNMGDSA